MCLRLRRKLLFESFAVELLALECTQVLRYRMALSPIGRALEKAGRLLQRRHGSDPIATAELVAETVRESGCQPSSVLPADYSYNRVNRGGVSRAYPMFVQEGSGYYRFVGLDFPYTGPILWQPAEGGPDRVVGHSVNGVATFTTDPRKDTDPSSSRRAL
jgi:hypothetical protein